MKIKVNKKLDVDLLNALINNSEISELRTLLFRYKDAGFDSDFVYKLLESMRNEVNEDMEDRILEVMDIVAGFCSPNMKVWNNK